MALPGRLARRLFQLRRNELACKRPPIEAASECRWNFGLLVSTIRFADAVLHGVIARACARATTVRASVVVISVPVAALVIAALVARFIVQAIAGTLCGRSASCGKNRRRSERQ